ncbi:DNA-binding SARP family transcriptional activator [Conexibacter arvalis]|uniref:DNA-binding SARP family transcriptional activator n=1 Tax=Conexibacter arvalis TaxID=912552 RepID=A0A840IF56_9ACTN|nr:DNA-binding SARP family transcriptional activator [Conexibacter arvalis]
MLARLLVAEGRVVPVDRLVDDLWADPPEGAVGAVRTFVAALRRALEPQRPPRARPQLLVTDGPGYALLVGPEAVDARRFEAATSTASGLDAPARLAQLEEALGWWRGPAYAGLDEPWARTERARLSELRLHAVEQRAAALVALGRGPVAASALAAHVAEHPWREEGWRLLALALYRSGRQADALAVLRRARALLIEHLAIEPGPALQTLEHDILVQAEHLTEGAGYARADGGRSADDPVGRVWTETAAAYDRAVAADARSRLESTIGLLRDLAMAGGGGLQAARRQRVAAAAAAEELSDPELTARVIGAYDVPASWTRVDDPDQAAAIVAAADRTLARLPGGAAAARARLLATIALESRGDGSSRAAQAAREAEAIAREIDDPALLAFALNGRWMQCFERAGLARERDAIGAELLPLAERHGLVSYEILGHLIRMQARSALADFAAADQHAVAVDRLAAVHERPLAGVFTTWYRALRVAVTATPSPADASTAVAPLSDADAAYRAAAAQLTDAGMPGLTRGLPALALLCLRIARREPAPTDRTLDWGPYAQWARPLVLLADGDANGAAVALRAAPDPPPDLLMEAIWCLLAQAALALGDHDRCKRARAALAPAAAEIAGAGSGLLTAGPVATHLADLDAALVTR